MVTVSVTYTASCASEDPLHQLRLPSNAHHECAAHVIDLQDQWAEDESKPTLEPALPAIEEATKTVVCTERST